MLDLSRLTDAVRNWSPFSDFRIKILVPGLAALYFAVLKETGEVLQGHLDIETTARPNDTLNVRIRTQKRGCILKCGWCVASGMEPGKNLRTDQMVHQVVKGVLSGFVPADAIDYLVVSTKGLGEPLVVADLPTAFDSLEELFPQARFVVSVTGHKAGKSGFEKLLVQAQRGLPVSFEESLHTTDDTWRRQNVLPENPSMVWTVRELSSMAWRWKSVTGCEVRTTIGFGPDFDQAAPFDFNYYEDMFPKGVCQPQLTLLAPKDERRKWNPVFYMPALEAACAQFQGLGYLPVRFLPPALAEGGSCGTSQDNFFTIL